MRNYNRISKKPWDLFVLLGFIIFYVIILFTFCLALVHPANAQAPKSGSVKQYPIKQVPDFQLPCTDGKIINSKAYNGKYLVLHIATTWCPFCNAEAPHLQKLYEEYKAKGVEVLIIDVKEEKDLIKKALVDRFSLSFPVLLDSAGAIAASFAPDDVLPDLSRDEVMLASNLLIGPDGGILFFSLLDSKNFDAKLVELKSLLDELL